LNRLLKYTLIALVVATAGAIAAFFLAKKFEPEVKDAVVYELNRHLAVPVKVEDINLSLIQRFPYASLRFSNVVIPTSGEPSSDTLIFIDDLYLQIGILDFLKKDYSVSEAEVNRGFFNMEIYPNGKDNFHFWKESNDSAGTKLSLTNIELNDFRYSLQTGEGLGLSILVRYAEANGNFGEEVFSLVSEADLIAESIRFKEEEIYRETKVAGDVDLLIDAKKKVYEFRSSDIRLGSEAFKLIGNYDASGEDPFWTVFLMAERADLEKVVALVPEPNREVFNTYVPEGKADFDLEINTANGFDLDLGFEGLKGTFTHAESSGSAEVYSGNGTYRLKGSTSMLEIAGVEAAIGPGKFTTRGSLVDFESPRFDLELEGRMDLGEMKDFFNIQFAEILEGKLDIRGRLEGSVKGPEIDTERLLRGVNFHGEILLRDGAFKTVGRTELFEEIEGTFEIIDNAIAAENLQARVGTNTFAISGNIVNALPYLMGRGEKLQIRANLVSDAFNLSEFIQAADGSEERTALKLPADVGFNLSIALGKLTYKSFEAKDISGKAIYHNGLFTLNPLEMKFAAGEFKGGFRFKESDQGFAIASDGVLENMQVDEFFEVFDDFGQEVISHEQISGKLNAKIDLTCSLDTLLNIDKPSVKADVDLRISEGRLRNVSSLIDIAQYIEKNPLWEAFIKTGELKKRLSDIEFASLENKLSISNERITIPEMTISTSVLDLTASGTHDFDNGIDYSVNFRLSELLQTGRESDSEFGYIVDDGTGMKIFLRMTGTVENPQFATDKESAREQRKKKFEEEKKTFKGILKEEFGLFKADSTLTVPPEEEEETNDIQFEVEWGDKAKRDSTKKGKKSKEDDLYEDLEEDDDL